MARILLVDDDPLLLHVLTQILALLGHEVTSAADGRQALARLRCEPFDVILTDVLMPEADGLELIRHAARDHPHLPVIAMSGGSSRVPGAEGLQLARRLGAKAVLAKPFGAPELRETIVAVMDGAADRRAGC